LVEHETGPASGVIMKEEATILGAFLAESKDWKFPRRDYLGYFDYRTALNKMVIKTLNVFLWELSSCIVIIILSSSRIFHVINLFKNYETFERQLHDVYWHFD
jgi:hypothetical protein